MLQWECPGPSRQDTSPVNVEHAEPESTVGYAQTSGHHHHTHLMYSPSHQDQEDDSLSRQPSAAHKTPGRDIPSGGLAEEMRLGGPEKRADNEDPLAGAEFKRLSLVRNLNVPGCRGFSASKQVQRFSATSKCIIGNSGEGSHSIFS